MWRVRDQPDALLPFMCVAWLGLWCGCSGLRACSRQAAPHPSTWPGRTRNASLGALGANGWLYTTKCGTFYKPFNAPGFTTYFMEFGHRRGLLPDAQWEQARLMLLNEGREQAARLPGHLDPIYWLGEFDSENYNWMSRFSGLLWTEQFPDPVYGSFHAQHLGNVARALAHAGRLDAFEV